MMNREQKLEEGLSTAIFRLSSLEDSLNLNLREKALVRKWVKDARVALDPRPTPQAETNEIAEIGNQIHNIACELQNNEDVSERLGELASRAWRAGGVLPESAEEGDEMKPEEDKITQEELKGMFGSTIPIDVVEMIFDCPDDWTVGRLRSEVRKKSIEYKRTNWQNRLSAAIKDEQDFLTLFMDDE